MLAGAPGRRTVDRTVRAFHGATDRTWSSPNQRRAQHRPRSRQRPCNRSGSACCSDYSASVPGGSSDPVVRCIVVASGSRRSNSPACAPSMKASHSSSVNSTVRSGSREFRTRTILRSNCTSTHAVCSQALLLYHADIEGVSLIVTPTPHGTRTRRHSQRHLADACHGLVIIGGRDRAYGSPSECKHHPRMARVE